MKKFVLASAAVLSLGVGTAFAQPTITYTNGSTYDSATGVPSSRHCLCNARYECPDGCADVAPQDSGRRLSTPGRPRVGWAGFKPDQ